MTLSSSKLNEIAELYESIAASEQEVLNEIGVNFGGQKAVDAVKQRASNDSAFNKKLDALRNQRFGGSKLTLDKPAAKQAPTPAAKQAPTPAAKQAPTPAAKPAPTPAAKPAPTPAAKVTPTKPAAAGKSGMDIWKAKYANTLAKNVNPNGTQKGTGQSTMSKDAAELRSMQSKSTLKQSFEYDAYDLVLEYLLSQGHAETVAEAQYLMTEMDAEMIGDIVEGIADRTANAVGHQRAGTLGDADEMRKNQDATSASIGKMKRGSGAKVTPTLPGV
jgi:hypothetical protein